MDYIFNPQKVPAMKAESTKHAPQFMDFFNPQKPPAINAKPTKPSTPAVIIKTESPKQVPQITKKEMANYPEPKAPSVTNKPEVPDYGSRVIRQRLPSSKYSRWVKETTEMPTMTTETHPVPSSCETSVSFMFFFFLSCNLLALQLDLSEFMLYAPT